MRGSGLAAPWLFLSLLWPGSVSGGALEVAVSDPDGAPVADAVVEAVPVDAGGNDVPLSTAPSETAEVSIAQRDEQFVPYVSVLQRGTAVAFPNQDDILHNVYSFSKAKKFQLPLYRDRAPPVVFDRAGTVILGCNIHDWMVAYVYVLDTPYFAKTDLGGSVEIAALTPGRYRVAVDHPRKRKRGSTPPQIVSIAASNTVKARFVIALKPEWRPRKSAAPAD